MTNQQEQSLRERLRELLCRQCDGVSHADTCEMDKRECPVLQTAPQQILSLILDEIDKAELTQPQIDTVIRRHLKKHLDKAGLNYHFRKVVARAQLDKVKRMLGCK